jgi:hypothetical protein
VLGQLEPRARSGFGNVETGDPHDRRTVTAAHSPSVVT